MRCFPNLWGENNGMANLGSFRTLRAYFAEYKLGELSEKREVLHCLSNFVYLKFRIS
jgi:hypothetical protein